MSKARFARGVIKLGNILLAVFITAQLAAIALCLFVYPLFTIAVAVGLFLILFVGIWAINTIEIWSKSDRNA
jgi:hypothetical protein